MSALPERGRLGAVDFRCSRSVRWNHAEGWTICLPGRELVGDTEEQIEDGFYWEEPESEGEFILVDDPLWMIAVLSGTVNAEMVDGGESDPSWCRYIGEADPELAGRVWGRELWRGHRAGRPLRPTVARHYRFEVLIDGHGLIRRIGAQANAVGLQLGDYGAAVKIELPADALIYHVTHEDE